ncbi:unnamed protein product [Dovyalis caffra]|uniref:Uncharacterized protein n=1 Tax=Dovyalis caffra TaxID=77055 RepID=A0AAV1QLR8_9ROSI|nr:unnamed protein product [Dovyalis caffra]
MSPLTHSITSWDTRMESILSCLRSVVKVSLVWRAIQLRFYSMGNILALCLEKCSETFVWFKSQLEPFFKFLSSKFDELVNNIRRFFDNIAQECKEVIGELKKMIGETMKSTIKLAKSFCTSVTEGMLKTITEVKNAMHCLIDRLGEVVKEVYNNVKGFSGTSKQAARKMAEQLNLDFLLENEGLLFMIFELLIISLIPLQSESIMGNIIASAFQKVRDAFGWVKDKVVSFFKFLYDKICEALGYVKRSLKSFGGAKGDEKFKGYYSNTCFNDRELDCLADVIGSWLCPSENEAAPEKFKSSGTDHSFDIPELNFLISLLEVALHQFDLNA